MNMLMNEKLLSSLHLMQLVSPALPVGAYAYSQGFEAAVEQQWVADEQQAQQWLHGVMFNNLTNLEVPMMQRIYSALQCNDDESVRYWNQFILASRETSELLMEDRQLGRALKKLLTDLQVSLPVSWQRDEHVSYATMFIMSAYYWSVSLEDALAGYLWAWCENQVAAAIKIVPLGQTAGQRILSQLIKHIPEVIAQGMVLEEEQVGSVAPGLVMASCWHETQYSRLFRS